MLEILKLFNYSEPNIKIYQDKKSLEFGPSGFRNKLIKLFYQVTF